MEVECQKKISFKKKGDIKTFIPTKTSLTTLEASQIFKILDTVPL